MTTRRDMMLGAAAAITVAQTAREASAQPFTGTPPVNQAANRNAILSLGPINATVPIWERLVDSRTVELTANDNTPTPGSGWICATGRWWSRCRRACSA